MNEENKIFEPIVEEKKGISFVWLLPLIILGILGWVGYESYSKKGTTISILFKTAEGLKEGVTTLEYKGLVLGKVNKIIINDLNSVKVNILVNKDVAKYVALDSSTFWVKKPTVSLTKISGLSTIISGYKIELITALKNEKELNVRNAKYKFTGLEEKPNVDLYPHGYYVSLVATDVSHVEVETPLFYNNFQIGEIASKEFIDNELILKAYIYDKYNYLVNESSSFVMNKALKATFGPSGLDLEISSLYSALVGGITVKTSNDDAKKIKKDDFHVLHEDQEALSKKIDISITLSSAKGIDNNSSIMYKGLIVGKLKGLELTEDNLVYAKAFVYEKFKYLLTDKSSLIIQTPKVGFQGVKNLGNIITGNFIEIDYKKGKEKLDFVIENAEKNGLKDELSLSLYTKDLNSISENSKVYFKNIQIGRVDSFSLTKDFKNVKINLKIDSKYKDLINDKTLFYDMSSKLIELKNLDLNVNYSGIKPLLEGAISVVDISRKAKLTKESFTLYNSYKDVKTLRRIKTEGFIINAYFDNSFALKQNQSITYKGQEIGFVSSVKFNDTKSNVKLFIYSKYKKYLTSKSRFYKKGAVKFDASLSGFIFELDGFSTLMNGSIVLDNSSTKSFNTRTIYSSMDIMKSAQNSIEIIFDDVEGLKTEFSKVTYKGIGIGKVIDISLGLDHKARVKVQVTKDYESFAKRGTTFYLKKPKISLNEVANIGSSVMPVDIGVIRSTQKAFANSFKGYDSIDNVLKHDDAVVLNVTSLHPTSVSADAPIYYKNVKIGKVQSIDLSHDGSKILLKCQIENRYKHLVRSNSEFYDISGFEFKFSLFSGAKVETNTITSILKGGLLIVTPYEYDDIAEPKSKFILKKNTEEGWEKMSPSIKIRD